MKELFKAEVVRFGRWALAFAGVHLLVLGFMTRVADLAQLDDDIVTAVGALYALVGLLLGLYQMGHYRRASTWMNLLHRPLAHGRIAFALFGAGAALLALAIALPVLVIAGWQEALTARVVDMRHWVFALAALQLAVAGYLAGGYCMLAGRRSAVAALAFLPLLLVSQASGLHALALQALVLLWLAALVRTAFKPDLDAPPGGPMATLVTALPLQMAMYLLLLVLAFAAQMLWIMQGTHPNNMATPPPGGHNEFERMEGRARMTAGLAGLESDQAALWREQIALSDVHGVGWALYRAPLRHELTNSASTRFEDGEARVQWIFSHDRMRFVGHRVSDGRAVGELGFGTQHAPFEAPAVPVAAPDGFEPGDVMLFAGSTLYHYVSRERVVLPRLHLPEGELLLGISPIGENIGVRSNRALYFVDGRDVADSSQMLVPRQRVAIPGGNGDLSSTDLIELVDGYLVSFAFTRYAHSMDGASPYQQLLHVDDGGRVTTVARRNIGADFPAVFRYHDWWPSPAMHALRTAAMNLFSEPDPLQATHPAPIPNGIVWLALLTALASAAIAGWRVRRLALSRHVKALWVAGCALASLPALMTLWLLYTPEESTAFEAQAEPALS